MFPIALVVPIIVTRDPRSVEVTAPTCFQINHFNWGLRCKTSILTHVINVFGRKVIPFHDVRDVLKKTPTVARLNGAVSKCCWFRRS